MRLSCPAKVNLHLEVGERRPDGYHSLVSLYQGLDLADDLLVEAGPLAIEPSHVRQRPVQSGLLTDELPLVLGELRLSVAALRVEVRRLNVNIPQVGPAGG